MKKVNFADRWRPFMKNRKRFEEMNEKEKQEYLKKLITLKVNK